MNDRDNNTLNRIQHGIDANKYEDSDSSSLGDEDYGGTRNDEDDDSGSGETGMNGRKMNDQSAHSILEFLKISRWDKQKKLVNAMKSKTFD